MKTFDDLYIVLEYVEADLKKVLKSTLILTKLHIQVIVYNILCALQSINTSNVLHRDIKPSNILVDEDCFVKLCDFGLARSMAGIDVVPQKYYEDVKQQLQDVNIKRC